MTQPSRILWFTFCVAALLLLPSRAAAQSATVTDDAFLSINSATQSANLNGQGIVLVVAGSSAMAGSPQVSVGLTKAYIKFQLASSLPPGKCYQGHAEVVHQPEWQPGRRHRYLSHHQRLG